MVLESRVVIPPLGWYHLNKLEKVCRRRRSAVDDVINALFEHGPEPSFPCVCPKGDKSYTHFFHEDKDRLTRGRDAYSALVKKRLRKKSRTVVRKVRAKLWAHIEQLRKAGEPEEYEEYNSLYIAIFS